MKKHNNRKGFTLAELLIVVAIIGVLTVVAVPIFTTQLEKSKEATDIANLREAKAAAVAAFLADDTIKTDTTEVTLGSKQDTTNPAVVYYDVTTGKLAAEVPEKGYGKGTTLTGDPANDQQFDYDVDGGNVDQVIQIKVASDGSCKFYWVDKKTPTPPSSSST